MQTFKNFLLIFLSLLFGLGIVAFSAFRVNQAGAQNNEASKSMEIIDLDKGEDKEEIIEMSQERYNQLKIAGEEPVNVKVKITEVDYYLPYPGILPDHPLYWLKMLRDRILLTFTKKPEVKFERLLLYADKRIGAARALIEGGKTELGVSTTDKAEKYLEQALNLFIELTREGKATPEMKDTINKASQKHIEVLGSLLDKVSDQSKATIDSAMKKTQVNLEKIKGQFD